MELIVALDHKSRLPVYRQLSDALKECIELGRLSPGELMPSVRALASSLSTSRATVLKAYFELQTQGYLEARAGAGTFVTDGPPGSIDSAPAASTIASSLRQVDLSAFGNRLLQENFLQLEPPHFCDSSGRLNAYTNSILPLAEWKKLLARHTCKSIALPPVVADPFGYMPLREALIGFLGRSRAVRGRAEQVAIFSNRETRLDLLCRVLLNDGDCVALENPGYYGVRQTVVANGAQIVTVPVDQEGISVDYLRRSSEKIKFVYVSPSVHAPSGLQMSLKRRLELLDWAQSTGAFIVEDDYDSEYRQGSNQTPSLQGLDKHDCVIYLRCFKKVMAPLVRLSIMVVPRCLKEVVCAAKFRIERELPLSEQQALTDFINEGFLERQIKKSRDLYLNRRCTVIFALTHYIGRKIQVSKIHNGTFVQVWFNTELSVDKLLKCAEQAGVPMISTRPYYMEDHVAAEFLVSFDFLPDDSIGAKIMRFAYLLDNAAASENPSSLDFAPDLVQRLEGSEQSLVEDRDKAAKVWNEQPCLAQSSATDDMKFAQLPNTVPV